MSGNDENNNASPYIDWGEPLPRSYAENCVVAMVCDPDHLFIYWDVATNVRVAGNQVILQAHCLSEGRTQHIESGPADECWYLQVTPNRTYKVELYERTHTGDLRLLAASDEVSIPVRHPGDLIAGMPAEIVHAKRHPLARCARPQSAGDPWHNAPSRLEPIVAADEPGNPVGVPGSPVGVHSGGL